MDYPVQWVLFSYPILLLSVRNAVSTCYVLLLILSLVSMLSWRQRIFRRPPEIVFPLAMASLFVFTVVNEVYHSALSLGPLDGPSRFLFAVPIYWMLRNIDPSRFRLLEFSFPLGVLTGLLTTVFLSGTNHPFFGTYFLDAPMWGGGMLTLGCLSLGAINWFRRDHPAVLALKLTCGGIGIFCALATGERGIWIAIPVLLWLLVHYRFALKYRVMIGTISIAAALVAYWIVPEIPERIAYTQTEIHKIFDGNLNTSVGQRLQIYRAAVEAIREHPFAGAGPDGEASLFRNMARRGWFTAAGLHAGLSQVHDEILANTLRLGIFGLLSILAIYFVPMKLFMSEARVGDPIRRSAALMGAMIVIAYFIFGLSIEVFNLKMFATYYAVSVAVFMALVRNCAAGQNQS